MSDTTTKDLSGTKYVVTELLAENAELQAENERLRKQILGYEKIMMEHKIHLSIPLDWSLEPETE